MAYNKSLNLTGAKNAPSAVKLAQGLYEKRKLQMNKNLSRLIVLLVYLLSGCGGSSSSGQGSEIVLGDGYDEKPGDVFTTSLALSATFSNGQSGQSNSTQVDTYSLVNTIPAKYGYSNSNNGPYLLETNNEDGVLDGLEYMTISGDFLIEDDLEFFSSTEFTTESGSEEPANIRIGDKFSFNRNSTLFGSQTGLEAGFQNVSINFSVLAEERISVPAGTFNAVKIGYETSLTESKNNIVDTLSGSGFGWFDTTNGFMLKLTLDGNMTLGAQNVSATFTSESTLLGFSISQSRTAPDGGDARYANKIYGNNIYPMRLIHSLEKVSKAPKDLQLYNN